VCSANCLINQATTVLLPICDVSESVGNERVLKILLRRPVAEFARAVRLAD
jgi:hypothetical protein